VSPVRIAFVPPVPALLASYAGLTDPVAELRAACLEAVAWLVEDGPPRVAVLGDPLSAEDVVRGIAEPVALRIGAELLAAAGWDGWPTSMPHRAPAWLVLGNGAARRGEKAPGHLDDRSFEFDEVLGKALSSADKAAIADLDEELASQLMVSGLASMKRVAALAPREGVRAETRYADDPFGVQYWVVTWQCGS
jgi:hypothetical protein